MEAKMISTPFDLELAKKITNGEIEGRIVTRDDKSVRIVCFDAKQDDPIVALISCDNGECVKSYAKDGIVFEAGTSPSDLMLKVPEYMTFKEGDVLTYRPHGDRWCIFVCKERAKDILSNYVTYDCDSRGHNIITFGKSFYDLALCKPSTEKEREQLIDALKTSKEPQANEYLKRFFGIEEKPKCEFKPFDKVLVRDLFFKVWYNDIFSFVDKNGRYMCIGNVWDECIPYNEQTAHLLGTTENYK